MRAPYLDDGDVVLYLGDCVETMREMEAESVDAIVCDPPAGISFMGKSWDHHRGGRDEWVAWMTSVMAECLRVLKPGGHALVWALPRTSHWTGCAIESAGFEVRDRLVHLFGSGFPKSANVSKQIDKAAGAEREVVGPDPNWRARVHTDSVYDGGNSRPENITAPATPEAAAWEGWGTALKPAAEDWWLARKPLAERTVAAQVLATGTGAINVDATRIGTAGGGTHCTNRDDEGKCLGHANAGRSTSRETFHGPDTSGGRWPANVALSHSPGCREVGTKKVKTGTSVLRNIQGQGESSMFSDGRLQGPDVGYADADGLETTAAWECEEGCAVRMLDAQSGETTSSTCARRPNVTGGYGGGLWGAAPGVISGHADTGGASRFFYTAKASRADRNLNGADNTHPTVKPTDLMRWLVRMVTPPGGVVLDCFAGSGSTLVAARAEGFRAIGIEREAEYAEIIAARLSQLSLLGGGD